MTLKLGYARVSTQDTSDKDPQARQQTLEQQLAFLDAHGVPPEHTWQERVSGTKNTLTALTPEWAKVVAFIEEHKGEDMELVVTRLDRITRSQIALPSIIDALTKAGVSLTYEQKVQWKPTQPIDLLQVSIEAYTAAEERRRISERTKAKLAYLKNEEHMTLGRPRLLDEVDLDLIRKLRPTMGALRITNHLNERARKQGRRTPGGKPWSITKTTVIRALREMDKAETAQDTVATEGK